MNRKVMALIATGGAIIFGSLLSDHVAAKKKRKQKINMRVENLKKESIRRLEAG